MNPCQFRVGPGSQFRVNGKICGKPSDMFFGYFGKMDIWGPHYRCYCSDHPEIIGEMHRNRFYLISEEEFLVAQIMEA
jgi:hypothetical protein